MTDERHSKPSDDEFGDFYRTSLSSVIAFFSRRGFEQQEARDLAQDTFLRAFFSWEHFRGEASRKTWVLRIAANVWHNELRARGAQKRAASLVSLDDAPELASDGSTSLDSSNGMNGPYNMLLDRQRRDLVRSAIHTLPPRMRACLDLYLQDRTPQEIASRLSISEGAVSAQLSFARKRLRDRLRKSP